MKSSMTTRSLAPPWVTSLGDAVEVSAAAPLVIRARATALEVKEIPRKDRLPSPAVASTSRWVSRLSLASKNWMRVLPDVDTAGSTRIQFFDANDNLLTQRDVLATAGDGSLSFLGISFTSSAVARARITSGAAALTSTASPNDVTQGGASDLVVMDDFIYGESVAVSVTVPAAQEVAVNSTRTFSAA